MKKNQYKRKKLIKKTVQFLIVQKVSNVKECKQAHKKYLNNCTLQCALEFFIILYIIINFKMSLRVDSERNLWF